MLAHGAVVAFAVYGCESESEGTVNGCERCGCTQGGSAATERDKLKTISALPETSSARRRRAYAPASQLSPAANPAARRLPRTRRTHGCILANPLRARDDESGR